jgi:NAD(P)-dependent dehydrogenase (short-subunit alcohol dehydrogenase family)
MTGDYSIINISSVHESTPMPLAAPYSAFKGGMESSQRHWPWR